MRKLLDYSTAVFKGCEPVVIEKSENATIKTIPAKITLTFEEWLSRGYVYADGICKKLKSQKTIGEITVFEVEDFPKKTTSFVVKRGNDFSHGETKEKAIDDLRYKISDRDTSEFECWRDNLDKEVNLEDAIAAYRTITGACESGTKEFIRTIQVPKTLTPNVILDITKDKFGSREFQAFLKEGRVRKALEEKAGDEWKTTV